MAKIDAVSLLAKMKNMHWVNDPSPVSSMPALANTLGLAGLYVKRDDMLPGLAGGSKTRKLDYLLASAPFDSAPGFHGIGALGSGLLVALSQASKTLGKTLHAHMFNETVDAHVLDNLAVIASEAQSIHYRDTRVKLFLSNTQIFRQPTVAGLPVVPPGATNPAGMVGMVRAGLELADQIKAGVLPEPTRLYVPLGSGGTAAGLAVGLALGRVPTKIHAVAAIEKTYSSEKHMQQLQTSLLAWLTKEGISGTSALHPTPIVIDRAHLGEGYGIPTPQSLDAVRVALAQGIALEPIYTGKAFAALIADAPAIGKRNVLFWQTRRGAQPAVKGDWFARLPEPLQWRLRAM